jgi:hypothetical protein
MEYVLEMGENSLLQARYVYLMSHLSNDTGVVGFETRLDTAGVELGIVHYVDSLTTPENIFGAVNTDTLVFHYADGTTGKLANPFNFPEAGTVMEKK